MNWNWSTFITVGSVIAAILAWVTKLRWSKEFTDAKKAELEAKDATLKTKDEQIEVLKREVELIKEYTSTKVKEQYDAMKAMLEERIESLKVELERITHLLRDKEQKLEFLRVQLKEHQTTVYKLKVKNLFLRDQANARLTELIRAFRNAKYHYKPVDDVKLREGLKDYDLFISDVLEGEKEKLEFKFNPDEINHIFDVATQADEMGLKGSLIDALEDLEERAKEAKEAKEEADSIKRQILKDQGHE